MLGRSLRLALTAALAATFGAACGGDGGGGPTDGTQLDTAGPDADLEVGFGPDAINENDGALDAPVEVETPFGAACTGDEECGTNGVCFTDDDFPGGYCSEPGCERNVECGAEGVCVDPGGGSFCADSCLAGTECRNGYACLEQPGNPIRACMPVGNTEGASDGEACTFDDDCRGGTCIDSEGWLDGYCTTTFCENFEDCASDGEDNRCLIQQGGTNFCVRICTENQECRGGYVCQGIGGGLGYCSPNPFEPIDVDPDTYPLDITCEAVPGDGILEIQYEVAENASAYMVTPYASDGFWLSPVRVDLPDGRLDFGGENDFQLAGAQLFGWTNPTIVPATAPLADQLQAGSHTYVLETGAAEICHYLLEESTPGTTVDFNVYLVGVNGLDAASAPEDPDMTAVLAMFDTIYEPVGVQIGEVRFYDITGDDATRYSILRDEAEVGQLAALSELPGETRDEALSVNVFFVRALAMGGAIGISSGLPGPAGLHGTDGSGVVFTSEFLGDEIDDRFDGAVDGNEYTGIVFAHEVGHYLGLFHTSEQFGFGYDPLPDTPRCGRNDFPDGCEDLNNLMFPFAGISHVEITEDQAWVIRVSPLTKD